MTKNVFEDVIEPPMEALPIRDKLNFESYLMEKVIGGDGLHEHKHTEEWRKKEASWVEDYATAVSDIIDKSRSVRAIEIRRLILEKKYEEASEMVLEMLRENTSKLAA